MARVLVLLAAAALAAAIAAAAGQGASARWLVFETKLSWTRTATITSQPSDEVECASTARMTAQSGRFYIFKSRAKRGHFMYASAPRASAARYAGASKLKVSGTARLEIGPMTCDGRPDDTTCAGTFTARLEVYGFHTSALAEDPHRVRHLNWYHVAPVPPTPPLPLPCMRGQDRGHGLAAAGLFFSAGLTGGLSPHAVQAPIRLMLSKRRFVTRTESRDTQWLSTGVPMTDGTIVATATFVRVR